MKGRILPLIAAFFLTVSTLFFPVPAFASNPPDSSHSTISGTEVPADGSTVSKLTITLHDSSDTALSGDSVTIYSADSTARFNTQTTVTTSLDGSGIVHVDMTATTVGGVNVTILDTPTNTTITGTVTFDQPGSSTPTPTPSSGCVDLAPGGSVQLNTAVSAGAHSITITWTDATDPVSYYLVSYGISSGQYIYGNPNVGAQGTTSYTVGGLATGKRYYFVVRAGNGCSPGAFSNELSEVAGGAAPTAAAEDTSTDTTIQTDQQPTDTPENPTDTPIETPVPAPAEAASGAGTSAVKIGLIIAGSGILLAIIGGVIYIRSKKKRVPRSNRCNQFISINPKLRISVILMRMRITGLPAPTGPKEPLLTAFLTLLCYNKV